MNQLRTLLFAISISATITACKNGGETSNAEASKVEEMPTVPDTVQQEQKTVFQKTLTAGNISFEIETTGEGSLSQLTIQPKGLEIDNLKVEHEINGQVVDAVIGDLNADGFPEVLIYTVSAGSGSYGSVLVYSVNNGKSMSQIYLPELSENKAVSVGYMGHDTFDIVKNALTRSFPIYKSSDSNSNPTGGTRQIQYRLKDGEASRLFVIDKISEN